MYDLNLLTNDSKYLIGKLYAEYISRRNNKLPKRKAKSFDDIESIHKTYMNEWLLDDVLETCFELKRHGFLTGVEASNTMISISITSEAIASLETDFADKADTVLEWAAKIKNAIPFT